jgi:toxin-antitoxin system PIN domain toxin
MTFLLDVNVLIALIDSNHIHHNAANLWFDREGRRSWATCPMTENGVLRIVGSSRYPNSPGTPAAVAEVLIRLCALEGHVFWPDDISLRDSAIIKPPRLLNASHLTDTYLLALAVSKGGRLATLDRRLIATAVRNGAAALSLIDAPA